MSEKQPRYAVIDVLEGDYSEFRILDTAREYTGDLACKKDCDYEIKTVMVCDEWSSDDLLPGEKTW